MWSEEIGQLRKLIGVTCTVSSAVDPIYLFAIPISVVMMFLTGALLSGITPA